MFSNFGILIASDSSQGIFLHLHILLFATCFKFHGSMHRHDMDQITLCVGNDNIKIWPHDLVYNLLQNNSPFAAIFCGQIQSFNVFVSVFFFLCLITRPRKKNYSKNLTFRFACSNLLFVLLSFDIIMLNFFCSSCVQFLFLTIMQNNRMWRQV